MNRSWRFAFLVVGLVGCASMAFVLYPVPSLVTVEKTTPGKTPERLEPSGALTFEDEVISITWKPVSVKSWEPAKDAMGFVLTNKTQTSLRLNWDHAAFVDFAGKSGRVMHGGVRFLERDKSLPPSVVAAGGNLQDFVVPVDNVSWTGQSWRIEPMLPAVWGRTEAELKAKAPAKGWSFKILIPLEAQGQQIEYLFTFEVEPRIEKTQ